MRIVELGGAPGYQVLVQSQTGAFPISNSLLTMVSGWGPRRRSAIRFM
jgi:hypothetical protein